MNTKESKFIKSLYSILETILINYLVYFFFFKRQANQEVYLLLNPNPLLFLSLIMGLRYGIKLGTFSAFISCLFYLSVYGQINGSLELFFSYFKYYKYPLLFLWSGFILGAFKDNHIRQLKNANDNIEVLTRENNNLEIDFKNVEAIQKELKNQIIKSDESIASLYEIAIKLESFEMEDVYTETIGILKKYLKVNSISLYTLDDDQQYLRLKISYGDIEEEINSIKASTCPWFFLVNKEKKVVKNPYYKEGESRPLMIAPLIRDNKIIAVVCINNMEFSIISEYALNFFQLITDWTNRALEKATFVESLMESKYIENTKLIKDSSYFIKHINIEQRRKNEFDMEFCLFSYMVKDLTVKEIDSLVSKTLRTVDLPYYNEKKQILTLLLPATKRFNGSLIEKKIDTNFGNKLVKIDLKFPED